MGIAQLCMCCASINIYYLNPLQKREKRFYVKIVFVYCEFLFKVSIAKCFLCWKQYFAVNQTTSFRCRSGKTKISRIELLRNLLYVKECKIKFKFKFEMKK